MSTKHGTHWTYHIKITREILYTDALEMLLMPIYSGEDIFHEKKDEVPAMVAVYSITARYQINRYVSIICNIHSINIYRK